MVNYTELYKKLNYKFKDEKLLQEALTHPSLLYKSKEKISYERLEFLGDSILSFVIIEYLFKKHKKEQEGGLSKRKAVLVCTKYIAKVARKIGLDKYLLMSKGEMREKGDENEHNLENAMEALIGAFYLDAGIQKTRSFIIKNWACFDKTFKEPPKDVKTRLQEWTQKAKKGLPEYKFVEKTGEEHKPEFLVELQIEGLKSIRESGASKKEAQKKSATKMLKYIQKKIDKNA